MASVSIALGSNLGDRAGTLLAARERLAEFVHLRAASRLYETEPVGYRDQPPFLNAVVAGATDLQPLPLLHALQQIEHDLGRRRSFLNAPRTLDLDLLYYNNLLLSTPELILPHPRLHERFFVLLPLNDIAPHLVHPRLQQTTSELLAALGPPSGVRVWEDAPWVVGVSDG